jgi:3-hydroxyacyl-[acyl-carrier-protein] dehydratase
MKFILSDKITKIEPGSRIETVKNVSLAEEYLQDHFPAFPILPGVLMIESLTQAAAWLLRVEQKFSKSVILLRKAQNTKYANFVAPGNTLRVEVEAISMGDEVSKFKGDGYVGDKLAVSGKFELVSFNTAERPDLQAPKESDGEIIKDMKKRFALIRGPEALEQAGLSWPL